MEIPLFYILNPSGSEMKNSWLIILFSFTIFSGYSQHEPLNTYSQRFQRSFDLPGEDFDQIFPHQIKYRTDKPQPIRETYWEWSNEIDSFLQSVRFIHTYNPSGLLISSPFQIWENDHWRDEANLIQVFNSHQQLMTQQYETWMNHTWLP